MKNNKVLAVALSAGLVLGGAYALEETNVAYAAEETKSVEEQKAELEDQIKKLEKEKHDIDVKKAQSKNAINWREGNRKVSDLTEEKLKQYEIWDENDRKIIEKCNAQMAELDKQIASLQEQIKALENSSTPGEGNPGNDSTDDDKAKALADYKKQYSEKIDDLSDLTEEEKKAAKAEIEKATSESEVTNAYNKAYSKNQDAKREREKKENEEKFAKAKEDAKKAIDDYGDKLTEKEKESFKEQIDKAPTKGAIDGILEEAKKASEKTPEPEEPSIDQDYKKMFLDNLLSLSKLTDEEKEAFKARIEKAKTNGEIYDIYNEAVTLNNSRDKKPETPAIDQDYKKMFLDNLLSLSKLTDEEKEAFKERIEEAKTNGEIYDIYNEAIELNNSRAKKPEKPVDPEEPTEPTDPSTPTEPEEPSKPADPSHDNDDHVIIPELPTNPSTTEVVKDDVIYVPKGYAHIKEGFYKKSDLIDRHNRLRKAVKENRIQVKAAEFLLEYTPKTVASVKDKLINLIEKSNKLVKKGKDVLEEYDKILDLDDKCYAL